MYKQKAQDYLELFANFTLTLILINTPISLENIILVIAY